MSHRVVFSPEAAGQLLHLYAYIARAASPLVAARYTEAIVAYCESLNTFPHRSVQRDDIRPGLRITHYRKRAVIAFAVDAEQVAILGSTMAVGITKVCCESNPMMIRRFERAGFRALGKQIVNIGLSKVRGDAAMTV